MSDELFLDCIRAALIEYQRRQQEPSESVARVVIQVERELQGMNLCHCCGWQKEKV